MKRLAQALAQLARVPPVTTGVILSLFILTSTSELSASRVLNASSRVDATQWHVGVEIALTPGMFVHYVELPTTFSTGDVQISYVCDGCGTVLVGVHRNNGPLMFVPLILRRTLNHEVAWFRLEHPVTSTTIAIQSTGYGTFEIQMLGSATK